MEDLIKKFLNIEVNSGSGSGNGNGSGDGSGNGYGSGSGSGYGSGSGSGSGDGDGDGSGYGSGSGSGSGDGDGSGYGYGSGDGDGSGSGSGNGDGSGNGYGSGSGSGSGYGSGNGYGYGYGDGDGDGSGDGKIKTNKYLKGGIKKQIHVLDVFKSKKVYYIDDIPCLFISIKNNIAKVNLIKDDFSFDLCFVAKIGNLFAHGKTIKEALKSVNDKFFSSISIEEKKKEFIKKFKLSDIVENSIFFQWHHLLTGSCELGRLNFIESKGISLKEKMSVSEFLNLTKNEYNSSIINEILFELNKNSSI